MSRGLTIAEFVQQVIYAIYKVRLDVTADADGAFHADTDKFKEIVFEANFVLQELQKDQDWNWLRDRWHIGEAVIGEHIPEYELPENIYKVCTGFNDSVRLHNPRNTEVFIEVPFVSPRSGTTHDTVMFDQYGRINVRDNRLKAFVVGDLLTFSRQFNRQEAGSLIETDVINLLEPLHICDSSCEQPCPMTYVDKVFTEIPDPYYMVVRTAAKRAEGDPSVSERVMSLIDEGTKLLSAIRENDSSKTLPDTYKGIELGYMRVL